MTGPTFVVLLLLHPSWRCCRYCPSTLLLLTTLLLRTKHMVGSRSSRARSRSPGRPATAAAGSRAASLSPAAPAASGMRTSSVSRDSLFPSLSVADLLLYSGLAALLMVLTSPTLLGEIIHDRLECRGLSSKGAKNTRWEEAPCGFYFFGVKPESGNAAVQQQEDRGQEESAPEWTKVSRFSLGSPRCEFRK